MLAEELAQALIAQAESMGVTTWVEVRETTIMAVRNDGGSFASRSPRARACRTRQTSQRCWKFFRG
jgi:hypothetical protein